MSKRDTLCAALLVTLLALFPGTSVAEVESSSRYIIWFNADSTPEEFESALTGLQNFEPLKNHLSKADAAQVKKADAADDDDAAESATKPTVFRSFKAVVVDLPRALAEELSQAALPGVSYVGSDFTITTFGDDDRFCDDEPADLPINNRRNPNGVCRVGADGAATDDFSAAKVWILDSGVDDTSGLLNVDYNLSRNCRHDPCDDKDMMDRNGHGTMVAGIVGSRAASPDSTPGLFGVAPRATIRVVKIFNRQTSAEFSKAPLRGLDYVWSKYDAASDDSVTDTIINISWGGSLIDELRKNGGGAIPEISKRLAQLAKKGLKIVIAAGNGVPDSSLPNWVQFVFPANLGGYVPIPAIKPGRIYTVSAVNSAQSNTSPYTWTDTWWNQSNYGKQPPDYAQPGVNVTSLWLKNAGGTANQTMTCSGTSFAAPHLVGVLARQIKNAGTYPLTPNGTATGDPYDPDPIAVSAAPITNRDCTP